MLSTVLMEEKRRKIVKASIKKTICLVLSGPALTGNFLLMAEILM